MKRYETRRDGVRIHTDRGGVVRARQLVFATGYESQEFLPKKVVKLNSSFALASEPLDPEQLWEAHSLIWECGNPYLYLRTTDDHRIIVGGEDESFRDPVKRDALIASKTKTLLRKFKRLFPRIPLEVSFAWAGTFGETEDGLPYIGKHRAFPHAWFALGYGGNGITYSALAAEIIRDALLGRPNPYADLFPFDR